MINTKNLEIIPLNETYELQKHGAQYYTRFKVKIGGVVINLTYKDSPMYQNVSLGLKRDHIIKTLYVPKRKKYTTKTVLKDLSNPEINKELEFFLERCKNPVKNKRTWNNWGSSSQRIKI